MFFSLYRQRERTKRELVARSGQNKSDSSNCAAELASLKQSSHCLKAPFFSRRICYLPLTSSNSLMLGIVQVNLALPSLNRDFLAIATLRAPSNSPEGGEKNKAGPLMVRAYINVRATSRSGYIPSSGGAWGGEALLELFSREKW